VALDGILRRSIRGDIMPLERKTIWLLVADAARRRLFAVDRRSRRFVLLRSWADDAAAGKGLDLVADRPGRTFDSAGQGRHAMEPTTPPKTVAKARFLAMLAGHLNAEAKRRAFDELHLVAAPRALGELREQLDPPVLERLAGDQAKDLTPLGQPELEAALGDRFWPS
jgi:protein required for attachment to host cells